MKIQYLSDIHLEVASLDIPLTDADIVVLAGDIHANAIRAVDWASRFPQEVIFVLGNHEFYSGGTITCLPSDLKDYANKYPNVHVLNNQSIVIDDVAFHGCTFWTDFELYGNPDLAFYYAQKSMSDYRRINFDNAQTFTPQLSAALHQKSVAWLSEAIRLSSSLKNVVVTHHLPTQDAIHEKFKDSVLNPAFASDCSQLFSHRITAWFYGHNHDCRVFEKEGIKFLTNQRGYHGYEVVDDFDAYKTLEI
ncbi:MULTISPECIES: metallophosphoesterase [Vibrio]|uniref:Metallophosphoesterase n=1 Tax=Vibrio kanaloae TaxID=170673 RepID=A0ABV4LFH9_9VIBR|nr:metallophosphoesterase [Vibrio kanaloae]OEF15667.1 metallophosphoesterase [Vibrio kanaloae 5S-149]